MNTPWIRSRISTSFEANDFLRCFDKMIALFLIGLSAFVTWIARAQAQPDVRWASRVGGSLEDTGTSVACDAVGNVYMTGNFMGAATIGEAVLTSRGSKDTLIAKHDRRGRLLWVRQAGGSETDNAHVIAVDRLGNCFVTGLFHGTAEFEQDKLTSSGHSDMYIAKYDSSGNLLWARHGGGADQDAGLGIAVDPTGHAYVTGHFKGAANFGGMLVTSRGLFDTFIAKYDPSGNVQWVRPAGARENEIGLDIAVDAAGNCYATGRFEHTTSFGAVKLVSRGSWDAFIARYDSAGNVIWARQAGGAHADFGRDIAVDAAGNVYVTGTFEPPAVFGTITLTTGRSYVAKYNSSGSLLWVRPGWGSLDDEGYDLALDLAGNPYVTYGGRISNREGPSAIIVSRYSGSGVLVWSRQFTSSSADFGHGIAVDPVGSIYLTGRFSGTAKFDEATLQSAGGRDIFIAKLGGPPHLSVRRSGNDLVVSWSSSDAGFVLQSTASVGPEADWVDVSQIPSLSAGQNTVTLNPTSGERFFRLRQQ